MKFSRPISRRRLVKGSAAAGAAALFAPAYIKNALSSSGEINVMFWSDELPEDYAAAESGWSWNVRAIDTRAFSGCRVNA